MWRHVLTLLACLSAAPAAAGPMPAVGQLVVNIGGGDDAVFDSGSLASLSGSLSGGGLSVLGGTFSGMATLILDAPPATGFFVTVANGPGQFTGAPLGTGSPLRGTMPIGGQSRITGFGGVTLIAVPFTSMTPSGAVTAGLGVGGTITSTADDVTVRGVFAPWTSGTATVMLPEANGPGTRTISAMGFVTPQSLQLVAPARITTSLADPTYIIATVTYEFVPEPALPWLLASGASVLAIATRRRSRKR